MDIKEAMEKRTLSKQIAIDNKERLIKAKEIFEMQKKSLTLQFEAITENPLPVKEQMRYQYEIMPKFIESKLLMEKARYLSEMLKIDNELRNLNNTLEQVESEING